MTYPTFLNIETLSLTFFIISLFLALTFYIIYSSFGFGANNLIDPFEENID